MLIDQYSNAAHDDYVERATSALHAYMTENPSDDPLPRVSLTFEVASDRIIQATGITDSDRDILRLIAQGVHADGTLQRITLRYRRHGATERHVLPYDVLHAWLAGVNDTRDVISEQTPIFAGFTALLTGRRTWVVRNPKTDVRIVCLSASDIDGAFMRHFSLDNTVTARELVTTAYYPSTGSEHELTEEPVAVETRIIYQPVIMT